MRLALALFNKFLLTPSLWMDIFISAGAGFIRTDIEQTGNQRWFQPRLLGF
jgi:hypothetical protein